MTNHNTPTTVTPEAMELIEGHLQETFLVDELTSKTYGVETACYASGMMFALTNPDLLRSQNLYTFEEFNAAKREGAEAGWDACLKYEEDSYVYANPDNHAEYVEEQERKMNTAVDKETFLSTLPPSEPVSKWIPVSENAMPEEDQNVLICQKDIFEPLMSTFERGQFYRYNNYTEGDRCAAYWFANVTHWQPLPSPPTATKS